MGDFAAPPDMNSKQHGGYPQQAYSHGYSQEVPIPQFAPAMPTQSFAPNATIAPMMVPQNPHTNNFQGSDTEPMVKGFEFSSETIRKGFIRKVYAILSLQLLFTLGCVSLMFDSCAGRYGDPCSVSNPVRLFVTNNIIVFYLALILVLVTIISISCCEGVRRTSPTNMIFLSLFTIGESYLVAFATIPYETQTVLLAVGLTAVVVVSLTIFAFQTKWDFTMMGGVLFVALMVFFVAGLIVPFIARGRIAVLIFSSFGAILFSAYLIHDTQLIMGGNHKYSISPEEYILGAITLFLDIINIFLYILRILGAATRN